MQSSVAREAGFDGRHDHDHHRDHHRGHHHDDHHHGPSSGAAFAIAVTLNAGFTLAEFVAGLLGGSLALIADAGHNLSDVLALLAAWAASVLVKRPPSPRFTYGLKSSSILAALANAALLWVAIGAILIETVRRFAEPAPVAGQTMIWVAAIGIAINGACAWLFASGRRGDLNIRAAFTHLLADAAVSAGVVIAGVIVLLTGWSWVDPVASLAITAAIGWGSWGLLRESVRMGLLGVPQGIDQGAVLAFLRALDGVEAVHDLHIWPMSTTESAITAHLVMPAGCPGDRFLHDVADTLHRRFGIGHPTLQIETQLDPACALHSLEVV